MLAIRDKEEIPRLAEGASQLILLAFKRMNSKVTEIQLVSIVRKARRAYAGRPMRFGDFFPLYDATFDKAPLAPVPQPPLEAAPLRTRRADFIVLNPIAVER